MGSARGEREQRQASRVVYDKEKGRDKMRQSQRKVWIIEKRGADGGLDFSDPQPPFFQASEEDLCAWWFREHPGATSSIAWLDILHVWIPSLGFSVRPKTW